MDSAPLPSDVLAMAEDRAARAKVELMAARKLAQSDSIGTDWLVDRPDLVKLVGIILDRPRRQEQYRIAAERPRPNTRNRIRELSKNWGINCTPEIDVVVTFYHQLLRAEFYHDPRMMPRSMIHDPDLDSSSEAHLTSLIHAAAELVEAEDALNRQVEIDQFRLTQIEAYVADKTREIQAAYDTAVQAIEESKELVRDALEAQAAEERKRHQVEEARLQLFRETQEAQKLERQQIEEARQKLLREAQDAQECIWWNGVASHPISSVIEKLGSIPDEHIETVLGLLLKLPATDPLLLEKGLHDFLYREHARLIQCHDTCTPLVIAHIGHLIERGRDDEARELLNMFPRSVKSTLDCVAAYLRFVVSKSESLRGDTYFQDLCPEDLYLGACYYDSGCALNILNQQSKWDCETLMSALAKSGDQPLNDFKVKGLQPRIAELAFRSVIRQLSGIESELKDLNLEHTRALVRPWRRTPEELPPADWKDSNGRLYDVKCNLFFRSKPETKGLRGLFIKRSDDRTHRFPGFIFTNSTKDFCTWLYVGEYQPSAKIDHKGDRVLPFCFKLPDRERFELRHSACEPELGMRLLCNQRLRIGWTVATGMKSKMSSPSDIPLSLLFQAVERCVNNSADTFLEFALWDALTTTTVRACNQYQHNFVESFLIRADELILGRTLPIRLPRIEGRPLLSRWISEVLHPLSASWDQIRWPTCSKCGNKADTPELRLTSAGSIYGRMTCRQCHRVVKDEVTILTHCYGCKQYPLIIGKKPTCNDCGGLICDCDRCKGEHCPRRRRQVGEIL